MTDGRRRGRGRTPTVELLDDLHAFVEELGHAPTTAEMSDSGPRSTTPYYDRYESWRAALEAAGVDNTGVSDRELLHAVLALADELGHPPTTTEMDEHGDYSASTYYRRFGSWDDALEAAGLRPPKGTVTDDDLLDELRRLADERGRPPTRPLMDEHGEYAASTYVDRFGSWRAALEAAGIDRDEWYRKQAERNRDRFLGALRELADELGRTPSPMDMEVDGDRSPSTAWATFDSWRAALEAAGLDVEYTPEVRTDRGREIIDDIRRVGGGQAPSLTTYQSEGAFSRKQVDRTFGSWSAALRAAGLGDNVVRVTTPQAAATAIRTVADELGHPPTAGEMNEHGNISATTARNLFGSWDEAIDAADLDPDDVPRKRLDDEQLLDALQALAEELGRPPYTKEMDERGDHASATLLDHFGSWAAALDAAGLDPEAANRQITRDELVSALQELAEELGRPPTSTEMAEQGAYSTTPFIDRFGSWAAALEAADLDLEESPSTRIPDDDLLDELRRLANEVGDRPSTTDMNEDGAHASTTYTRRFGSWAAALEAAGLVQNGGD